MKPLPLLENKRKTKLRFGAVDRSRSRGLRFGRSSSIQLGVGIGFDIGHLDLL